jgi:maltose alpha-D-glucosyltransferase/alpha-amylase
MTTASDWYQDGIIYQIHVRSFCDSTGDGIGDFGGLVQKLDYLQDLGVTAIWLMPFYPSPLKDDGYDIADYTDINPSYGTKADFERLLKEAHRRNLKVITELVLNHTSDQHPWFQRARRAKPGSRHREYYVWSDTPDRYRDARIIFQDFESSNWTWDAVAGAHYWHRFYHHQPDLNYDHPDVRKAMLHVLDYWLDLGVDGLRLDAVPYLFEREHTSCENLPETHEFLRELRSRIDARFEGRMVLAEANQWPEDAVKYFGSGDECHTAFHFPVMPRLFMAVQMEDRFPILDILEQTPAIPAGCQWVVFLRNHDELTLEMVTDEERDYMVRAYARDPRARVNLGIRRRLAPLVGNDRRKIELLNGLLMSLIGTPVIYYGDEIGMGDNIYLGDRNGVRTPMQWSPDRNAGFSAGNPQSLFLPTIIDHEYHYETVNVETQERNPHSLLWWMRRLIALRSQLPALGRGSLDFLYHDNAKVLAFVRKHGSQHILVVANLSRTPQFAQLDLSAYKNQVPLELFGRTEFPRIGALPYLLTLAPYAFYWFELRTAAESVQPVGPQPVAIPRPAPTTVRVARLPERDFPRDRWRWLEQTLAAYLPSLDWFATSRAVQSLDILDMALLPTPRDAPLWLAIVHVEFTQGEAGLFLVPLGLATGEKARILDAEQSPQSIAWLQSSEPGHERAALCDATRDPALAAALLELFSTRRRPAGELLDADPTDAFKSLRGETDQPLHGAVRAVEPFRTLIDYGDRLSLRLHHRLEAGPHPEVEAAAWLSESGSFAYTAPLAGSLHVRHGQHDYCAGVLKGFVRHESDGWQLAVRSVRQFLDRVLATDGQAPPSAAELPACDPLELDVCPMPPRVDELLVPFDDQMELLGQRTAELHAALAGNVAEPGFAPAPYTPGYQRSLYQGLRNQARTTVRHLRQQLKRLTPEAVALAEELIRREGELIEAFAPLVKRRVPASVIRIVGDLHLGRVLHTGKDFILHDLSGDEDRSLGERRIKRSPLRDVAGLLQSIALASHWPLAMPSAETNLTTTQLPIAGKWLAVWSMWSAAALWKGYLRSAGSAGWIPPGATDRRLLVHMFQIDQTLRQIGHLLPGGSPWLQGAIAELLRLMNRPKLP